MKALIVVDAQYDFMPVSEEDYENGQGGALAVKNGDQIVPVINELLPKYDLVVFTKDWHPNNMEAFASSHEGKNPFEKYINEKGEEDVLWPDHCIAGTRGADLHDDIKINLIDGNFYIFKKGTEKNKHPYSGFSGSGLSFFLQEKGVDEVDIVGLATDFCVRDTALDAVKNGFKTNIIWDGCKGIAEDLTETYNNLIKGGVIINGFSI